SRRSSIRKLRGGKRSSSRPASSLSNNSGHRCEVRGTAAKYARSQGLPGSPHKKGIAMNKPVTEFSTIAATRANYPALERWTYMDLAAIHHALVELRMMNGG